MAAGRERNWKPVAGVVVLLIVAGLVYVNRGRIDFDWGAFWRQLRHVNRKHLGIAVGLIYMTYLMRAPRWAMLISQKTVPAFSLIGSQFIGFTAVALFGRIADLTRPYLIAKRTQLPLSSQVAVYTIERMFDLGSAALLFSGALVLAPKDLPHHEVFVRAGVLSLAGTLFLAGFMLATRLAGEAVARVTGSVLGRLSAKLGAKASEKILDFRGGLAGLSSRRNFLVAGLMSLAIWTAIAYAYLETAHAFQDTPELASVTFSRIMLLLAASIGGSLLQLPVIGWFTQIAVTATAMHTLYNAPVEAATACGAVLLGVTFLSIVPVGFLFARFEHVSINKLAGAAETLEESAPVAAEG